MTSARAADEPARLRAAQARSRLLRRGAAALIIVGALAVVIGPHLIDDTRISSVVAQAAKDDGGPPVDALSCPTTRPPLDSSTSGVVLVKALVCDYPSGFESPPSRSAPIPPSGLPALTADLAAGTSARPPGPGESLSSPTGSPDAWAVIGLTTSGQRIELVGRSHGGVYAWTGIAPLHYWRPSADVLRMLTADLDR